MSASPGPETVGPYTVLGELGRGGMGRVLLAAGPDGTRVAVKVIRSDLASDARFRARFRREIDTARLAPARYTARVLAADPDAARPWVATEYVPGPTLEAHVREHGPLEAAALRRLALGLLRALVALQRAGLVHRDLKPSNVLLTGRGPRLIDFGIARAADDTRMTTTGALVGTPAYMAPEQALGDREIGPAADVHAFGAILVFAATGAPPYPGATAAAVLYRKLHREAELGDTPEPERGRAWRCLDRDPDARPDAAALLAETLRPRRRRLAGAVAALALVLALGAGVVAVVGGGGAAAPPTVTSGEPAATGDGSAAGTAGGSVPPGIDPSVPGSGPAVTAAPARPATVTGQAVDLGFRAGRVAAGVGRVYVTDADTGAVTVLDPSGRTVGRVDVGRFPAALALSPDGARLYATLNTAPTRVVAVDTATLRVAATADLPAGDPAVVLPADMAVTPDGRTVVVGDPRGSRVVALDAGGLGVRAQRAVPAVPVALAVVPGGDRVLVAGGTPGDATGVTVLALPDLAVVATAAGVGDPRDVAADPDGTRGYLSDGGRGLAVEPDPGLRVLETSDGRERAVLDAVGSAERLLVGAGGRWLYALDPGAGEVRVVDLTGQRPVGTVAVPDAQDVAAAPDGRALYVAAGRELRILTSG